MVSKDDPSNTPKVKPHVHNGKDRIVAKALRNYNLPSTTSRPARGTNQVQNNSGGFTFQVADKERVTRFLILGTDGGTYYVKDEADLTKQNVDWLVHLIHTQGGVKLVRDTAVEISDSGRAYRNDAAIFVMALLLADGTNKAATVAAVPRVVRTGTHAYLLARFIEAVGGWGPAKMAAIRAYLASKDPASLAYDAVKYRQREGWTHRDLFRVSHPKGTDPDVAEFILRGTVPLNRADLRILNGFDAMQHAATKREVLNVLTNYSNLPWETIPTQFHKEPAVWQQLFYNGQLKGQALLRNVTRLAKLGLFNDAAFRQEFGDKLRDEKMIAKTRLHPMQYLNAYVAYNEGQGKQIGTRIERERTWVPDKSILDALDDGFGLSFGNIEPAGKATRISVDTSASMGWWMAGNTQLSAYQAAAAMALITARTEPDYAVDGFSTRMSHIDIRGTDTIGLATDKIKRAGGGGTNIALPIEDARQRRAPVETFVIITDNEVNPGYTQPHVALERFRQEMGIPARLVVMAVVPTKFTVANPDDKGMLDVVGFDTNTPRVLADFSAGRI